VATLAQLRKRAAELGAIIHGPESSGRYREVSAEAPAGRVWSEGGASHELIAEWLPGPGASAMAYADLLERMAPGVEPCEHTGHGCEWCDQEAS
jgi:hypothetical protein